MGSFTRGHGPTCGWSVFDGLKTFPPSPDTLMAEIDAAIAASEHGRSTAFLSSALNGGQEEPVHDARLADEAYKAACAALAAGRPGSALKSLQVALASCPPDKPSAMAKLRSLVSVASSRQQQQIVRR